MSVAVQLRRTTLTPALSHRERGNCSLRVRRAGLLLPDGLSAILPLPAGEGRGEGNLTPHGRVMGRGIVRIVSVAVLSILSMAGPALADVKLPRIISDNMVLQQGVKTPIWGWAEPGQKVT